MYRFFSANTKETHQIVRRASESSSGSFIIAFIRTIIKREAWCHVRMVIWHENPWGWMGDWVGIICNWWLELRIQLRHDIVNWEKSRDSKYMWNTKDLSSRWPYRVARKDKYMWNTNDDYMWNTHEYWRGDYMMCEPMPITIGTRFDKSTPGFKLFFGWVNVEGRLRDRPYGGCCSESRMLRIVNQSWQDWFMGMILL